MSNAPIWPLARGALVKPLDGVASAPPAEDRSMAPSNTIDVNLRCISNLLKVASYLVSPDEGCPEQMRKSEPSFLVATQAILHTPAHRSNPSALLFPSNSNPKVSASSPTGCGRASRKRWTL